MVSLIHLPSMRQSCGGHNGQAILLQSLLTNAFTVYPMCYLQSMPNNVVSRVLSYCGEAEVCSLGAF